MDTLGLVKTKILKCNFLTLFLLIAFCSFGQDRNVVISNFHRDSLRVSVKDIIHDPVIKVFGDTRAEIISYDLILNINGVVSKWRKYKSDSIDSKKLQRLLEVQNDKPKYNQLFIDQVKYIDSLGQEQDAKSLYLWLAKETDCNGIYDIEEENYKNKEQIQYEYFWCDDVCIRINNYRKDGTLIGSKEYSYTPDTVVVTRVYRKDGSKIIYERQVNGKDDGEYFIYYPDGSIKLEAKNMNGVRVLEKIYDKNQRLILERHCNNNGSDCTLKKFNAKGHLKKEKNFKYHGVKYKAVW